MMTLVHGSDLHFGKPHDAAAAEDFLLAIRSVDPEVVVISGDFTQRAKVTEFEAAREFLDRLAPLPVVVTPGNHDVPMYRILERALHPFRNYLAHIESALDTVTRIPGATLVALNTAAPRRALVNGRMTSAQVEFARTAFGEAAEDDLRIVVAHHHLAPAPDYEGDKPLPRSRHLLDAFEAMHVDMILGGHLHRAYIGNSLDVYPGADRARGLVIVQSGTTTSHRGRAREREKNSFNVIRTDADEIVVTHWMRFAGGFRPFSEHRFPRRPHVWLGES
ncbi:MAG: 3',5'-cyclic-nucleotide phosphodiesterase [Gemmatimonadales bacterium]|nr:MAG: 3',5'-cyclic-nucleotide phosphodiesterase [Gemmatimonadales bacterium]